MTELPVTELPVTELPLDVGELAPAPEMQRSPAEPGRPSAFTQGRQSTIYLLRTAQQHHVQLSAMADRKAGILIGSSFVVLAIVLTELQRGTLPLPLMIFALFTFVAAGLSVLAVIPRLGNCRAQENQFNTLFFGHFAHLSEGEYCDRMFNILKSEEQVYRAFIRDIYQMGKVLYEKKYRYLTYSYRTFMAGLCATLVAVLLTLA
ncbi:MAG: Pycsar system effector family protein [Cyanobacteria bacterium J06648_11]